MICIFLADGFEDIEAIATMDILRRAGLDVKLVGVDALIITSAHGLKVQADLQTDGISSYSLEETEAIVLPGGMPGTTKLDKNDKVHEVINYCLEKNPLICAICAAPMILGKMGILKDKKACCYPGFEKFLTGAKIVQDSVCVEDRIITAKGPGAAYEFGFAIVEKLKNREIVEELKKSMICK